MDHKITATLTAGVIRLKDELQRDVPYRVKYTPDGGSYITVGGIIIGGSWSEPLFGAMLAAAINKGHVYRDLDEFHVMSG